MKVSTNTRLFIKSSIALTLAMAIWFSFHAWSEEHAETAPAMQAARMEQCEQMMEKKQKMMEDRKAQDTALTEKIAKMNSAPADQKVDLMAALITKMAEQRVTRQEKMENMRDEMMAHMMQHTQMGKETMSQCPMMKGMGGKGRMDGDGMGRKDGMGRMSGMRGMRGMDEKAADESQDDNAEKK